LRSACVGYFIGAAHSRQGFATEALQLILQFAFKQVKLHRTEANIQPQNVPSIALVKRAGFTREGYSRRYLKIARRWRDHERWAFSPRTGTGFEINSVQTLVEDFLQYLRHERGQAEHTQKTYAGLLNKFTAWARKENLTDWKQVELKHLMSFLQHERERSLANQPKESSRRFESESVIWRLRRCGRSIVSRRTKNTCR